MAAPRFEVGQLVELTYSRFERVPVGTIGRVEWVHKLYPGSVGVELYRRHRRTGRALALRSDFVDVDHLAPVLDITPDRAELLAQVEVLRAERQANIAKMKADRIAWEQRILAMASPETDQTEAKPSAVEAIDPEAQALAALQNVAGLSDDEHAQLGRMMVASLERAKLPEGELDFSTLAPQKIAQIREAALKQETKAEPATPGDTTRGDVRGTSRRTLVRRWFTANEQALENLARLLLPKAARNPAQPLRVEILHDQSPVMARQGGLRKGDVVDVVDEARAGGYFGGWYVNDSKTGILFVGKHSARVVAPDSTEALDVPQPVPQGREPQLAAKLATPNRGVATGGTTFSQGRQRLLDGLRTAGWETRPNLDVPRAISPDGQVSLWFKPQSVYYAIGQKVSLNDAHSLLIDVRKETPESFLKWLDSFLNRQKATSRAAQVEPVPAPRPEQQKPAEVSLDRLSTMDPRLPEEERLYRVALISMTSPKDADYINKYRLEDIERSWVHLRATNPKELPAWRQQYGHLRAAAIQRFNENIAQEKRGREFFARFLVELRDFMSKLKPDWHLSEQARASLLVWIRDRLYSDDSMIPLGRRKRLVETTFARLWRSAEFGDGPDLVSRTLARGYRRTVGAAPPPAETVAAVTAIISRMLVSTTLDQPGEREGWIRTIERSLDRHNHSRASVRHLAEELFLLGKLTVRGGYQ